MLNPEIIHKIKPFLAHGVDFLGTSSGKQVYGTCPFCDKEKHFYVNYEKLLWDCKVCTRKGNIYTFLKLISKQNQKAIRRSKLQALSENRGLDVGALKYWLIGWNGMRYTLPIRGFDGKYEDIRFFSPGKKTMSTPRMSNGLFGAMKLAKAKRRSEEIYVCEGEWDAMALHWLLRKIGKPGVVVGVPGASVFKDEWLEHFRDRDINLMYDHDEAGENGELLAFEKLKTIARSIHFLRFPDAMPTGFDVRDFLITEAVNKKKPKYAYKTLRKMLQNKPRKRPKDFSPVGLGESNKTKKPITAEEVFKVYSKWLKLDNFDCIKILFGSYFANKIDGDPMWMFLVGPPGSLKSELLMSLSESIFTYATASLTPHTLVSGAIDRNGGDPSLLPKLNNKILIVKDFTTILSMHYVARDEIFGTLRDAYDGKTQKNFGTGVVREYKVKFGIMAGVTPKIEGFGVMHQSLGERFIKYFMPIGTREDETAKIMKALDNVSHETQMRAELSEAGRRVCDNNKPQLPTIPDSIKMRIIYSSQLIARLRGVVERQNYTDVIVYKPSAEVATRLAKQFTKLGMGITMFLGKEQMGEEELKLIQQVARNTSPDRIEEVIKQMWKALPDRDDSISTFDICQKTRLPMTTIQRVMDDLMLLRVVKKVGTHRKYEWQLHDSIRDLIVKSEVYKKENQNGIRKSDRGEGTAQPRKKETQKRAKKVLVRS